MRTVSISETTTDVLAALGAATATVLVGYLLLFLAVMWGMV
ncbi:hypothetical protein ACLI4Z_05460 [Natrialbaceae archaeon A-arb3/5]